MEKLIELLNEFYKEKGDIFRAIQHNDRLKVFELENNDLVRDTAIISKEYGFIKWLVEHHKLLHPDFVQHLKLFYGDSMPEENFYLMMLAISPNPIEELCKMLRPN